MSQINVDNIKNRLGSGAPSFPNGIDVSSGVTTFTNGLNVGTGASVFSPGTNELALGTNSAERVRVDSSGNVGVGTDNPKAQTWRNGTTLDVYGGSGSVVGNLHIGANRGDGNQTVGSIAFYDNTQDTNHKVISIIESDKTGSTSNQRGGTVTVYVKEDATVSNSAVESATFTKDGISFPSGNGIDFSANGNVAGMTSELLDDYEEGDFTPTWQATTNSGTWAATGRYTKIGRLVTVEVKQTSGVVSASAQDHIISGLPFQPFTGTTGSVGSITDSSPLLNGSVLVWSLTRFYTAVAISSNSGLRISITYMTDD